MSRSKFEQITQKDYEHPLQEALHKTEGEKTAPFAEGEAIAVNRSYLTEADYTEFSRKAIPTKAKLTIAFWGVFSIIMSILLVGKGIIDHHLTQGQIFLSVVLLLFGAMILYVFFVRMPKKTARSYRLDDQRYMGLDGAKPYREYIFYKEGMLTRSSDGRRNAFYYRDLEDCMESKNLLILPLNMRVGYVMRKDAFLQGDWKSIKKHIAKIIACEKMMKVDPRKRSCC